MNHKEWTLKFRDYSKMLEYSCLQLHIDVDQKTSHYKKNGL